MKFFYIILLLLIATPVFAQSYLTDESKTPTQSAPAQTLTPIQTGIETIRQQRNQALSQMADMQTNLAYVEAQDKLTSQYWADYVKGLYGEKKLEK